MKNEVDQSSTSETELNPRSIAIGMITLYPNWFEGSAGDSRDTDKVRGDLALQSIGEALKKGYQVLVADGESSPSFKRELVKRGVTVVDRTGENRAGARRRVIEASSFAPGVRAIIMTEPEKVSLIEDSVPLITRPILTGEADIVLPARNEELRAATYPDYMYESETSANRRYNKILHAFEILPEDEYFDFFFGPTVLRNDPDITSLFLERVELKRDKQTEGVRKYLDPDAFSNSLLFPVVKALWLGLRVKKVEVPFVYPPTQKLNEAINTDSFAKKRKKQKWGTLDELVLYIRFLNDSNSPKGLLKKT